MGPSREQCPYDGEVWSLNMGYHQIAAVKGRLDKVFMVHKQVVSPAGTVYFDWSEFLEMAKAGVEMWNIYNVDCERCGTHIPFKKYPLDEIIEKFDFGYFTDTVCYMVAYALHDSTEGSKKERTLKLKYPLKIRLYGVDLQVKDEYIIEKAGVEAWIGYALGLGADVTISTGSTLLLTNNGMPYGFDVEYQKYLDPYRVLTTGDERMPTSEFELRKDEVAEAIEKLAKGVYPEVQKYQGECVKGLHRDTKLSTLEEAENDTTS